LIVAAREHMRGQPLFRKYMLIFVLLVGGALLTSGLLEIYFSYQENQAALLAVQREKALVAAARIEAFLQEVEKLVAGALPPPRCPVLQQYQSISAATTCSDSCARRPRSPR
jgi:hypothetical protein